MIFGVDKDAVGPEEDSLAPGSQEPAIAIEDDQRMLSPVEDIYAVARVGGDGGHFVEAPAVRKLLPPDERLIAKLAGSDGNSCGLGGRHGMDLELGWQTSNRSD